MSRTARKAPENTRTPRAAQYVRMSTDKQQYSTLNQMAAIASYAVRRNIDIVCTYKDEGRSGLDLDGRAGLQGLLRDVQSGKANFDLVLVYDVSRWGRFQDADEAAYYEFLCKEAGIQVHYCAEEFANDGSLASTILKNMKRVMAGEYSRELSTKVSVAHCHAAKMGYWQGSRAGYGYRRLMLDASGKPKSLMEDYQRKSFQTDRVVLTLGPANERKVIRRIFTDFVAKKKTRTEIAKALNADGIPNSIGREWSMQTIDNMLKDEKYIGNLVYNKTACKLHGKVVHNPADMWVRYDNAFAPIISKKLFAKAQERIALLPYCHKLTDKELLDRLKALLSKKGHLSCNIINMAKGVPHSHVYVTRFGSMLETYRRIRFTPNERYLYFANGIRINEIINSAANDIIADVEAKAGSAVFMPELNLLTINTHFTIVIAVAWAISEGEKAGKKRCRWEVRKLKYRRSDLTLLIRMNRSNAAIQDFFLLPSTHLPLTKDRKKLRVSDRVFGQFRHIDFDTVLHALHARLRSRVVAMSRGQNTLSHQN